MLYESSLASGLLGAYVQATSGGALYRKSTFLLDSLGKQVLPEHIDVREDPHVPRGKGSAPFDDEGVRDAAAQDRRRAASCRAISSRPIRRASSACGRPATPAARTT